MQRYDLDAYVQHADDGARANVTMMPYHLGAYVRYDEAKETIDRLQKSLVGGGGMNTNWTKESRSLLYRAMRDIAVHTDPDSIMFLGYGFHTDDYPDPTSMDIFHRYPAWEEDDGLCMARITVARLAQVMARKILGMDDDGRGKA